MNIDGTCTPEFEPVREQFEANFARDLDDGASLAVMVDGELVVDLWGGVADIDDGTPWTKNTITNVWSSSKNAVSLCALLLADRGMLDLDAPVADYWPDFAASGKDAVLVRHILSHSSGLSGWEEPMTPTDLYDWEKATSLLAAQAPWWEPGTASGYHALTRGYLVGELVRRTTGQSIGTFLRTELTEPLGADFHIGLDGSSDDRVSPVIPPEKATDLSGLDPSSITYRSMSNPEMSAQQSWTEEWRRAEIPSANGHGNARGLATLLSVLACSGEVAGRRYLSEATCRRVFEVQTDGPDQVVVLPIRFGIGYGLVSEIVPLSPNPNTCFWGGWGGSLVLTDLDARLSFAYVMNRMGAATVGDARSWQPLEKVYEVLAETSG